MIYFCDTCGTIKTRDDFDEFFTYEENICSACKERDPKDPGLTEEDFDEIAKKKISEMMFGEDDEDFIFEEDNDFVDDGEIDEENNDDEED